MCGHGCVAPRGESRSPIHTTCCEGSAKIWLEPVRLEYSAGFRRREVVRLIALVWEHHQHLLEAWNEYITD